MTNLEAWLDGFSRRHPRVTITLLFVVAVLLAIHLLQAGAPKVLYEIF